MVKVMGWENTLLFLRNHGKKTIYVPIKFDSNHSIYKGLGSDAKKAFYAEFHGQEIRTQGHKKMLSCERYEMIIKDHNDRDFDVATLMTKYQLPKPTIHWILKLA